MLDQESKEILRIQSYNQKDVRCRRLALFESPRTCKHHDETKTFKKKLDQQAMTWRKESLVIESDTFWILK